MKVVILAGGFGTRISEESHLKPKPMIEIGSRPILWHIMKYYLHYGFDEFIICAGYKQYVLKEYFEHYFLHESDVTFDFRGGTHELTRHATQAEPWRVTLCDTGLDTMTGGRIKRVQKYIGNEPFMLTYGDGVANVPLDKLLEYHKKHGKYVTVTSAQPTGRYGMLDIEDNGKVSGFTEKPPGGDGWISAGYFICQPEIFNFIDNDLTVWEREPMERLAHNGQVMAYRHSGFFAPMDSTRDKNMLEDLLDKGKAPWKVWE